MHPELGALDLTFRTPADPIRFPLLLVHSLGLLTR